jgi:hypothetical protein
MPTLQEDIDEQVTDALNAMGIEITNIWKHQVPVDTGKLRGSIRHKVVRKRGNLSLSFYYIYYGVYVDLGTYAGADTGSYGLSPFDLPPWRASPPKSPKGISARYWTSLSLDRDELLEYLATKVEGIIGDSVEQIASRIQSRTQRNTA